MSKYLVRIGKLIYTNVEVGHEILEEIKWNAMNNDNPFSSLQFSNTTLTLTLFTHPRRSKEQIFC